MTELRERAEWVLRAHRDLRGSEDALEFIATADDQVTADHHQRTVAEKRRTFERALETFVVQAVQKTSALHLAEVVAAGDRLLEERRAKESRDLSALRRTASRSR